MTTLQIPVIFTTSTSYPTPVIKSEKLPRDFKDEYSEKFTFPYGKWYCYERLLQVPVYVIFNPQDGGLEVWEPSLKNAIESANRQPQHVLTSSPPHRPIFRTPATPSSTLCHLRSHCVIPYQQT